MKAAGDAILIAAQSGRALAQSARRAGLRPFVADLFGDADTRDLAEGYRPLPGRFGGRLGGTGVLDALDALAAEAGSCPLGIVLGSGFEGVPDLIARIARRHRLLGAQAATVAALKDPFRFAALCARLSIPHPAVAATADDPAGWLIKRVGGSGGGHVRPASAGRAPAGHYLQRRVPGRAHALNILADGRDIAVLATTEQWSAPTPARPFRYAGGIARGRDEPEILKAATLSAVTEAVKKLVAATGLRGLASADILVHGEAWWLTEINPRPGATLDVLDRRPTPLLLAHIEASLGRLGTAEPPPVDAAGAEICYATYSHAAVPPLDWPDFVRDRPRAGSRVGRDAPFCTVTAAGPGADAVRRTLTERSAYLRTLLTAEEDSHEHRPQAAQRERADGPPRRAAGR